MTRLYEIASEITQAVEMYNLVERDEDLEKVGKLLTDLTVDFNEKALGVAYHIKNVESDIAQVEAHIARLAEILDKKKKQRDWFWDYVHHNMEQVGTKKIEDAITKLLVKKNGPSVEIEDESLIPDKYKRSKTTVTVDKKAILEDWKHGTGVTGAKIVDNKTHLEIK